MPSSQNIPNEKNQIFNSGTQTKEQQKEFMKNIDRNIEAIIGKNKNSSSHLNLVSLNKMIKQNDKKN